jgi:hypothetical protein
MQHARLPSTGHTAGRIGDGRWEEQMSQSDFGTDAERHRAAAAATEPHARKSSHHGKSHADHSADAFEHEEATFFARHRSKLAAGVMIVVATIFFVMVAGVIHW